ncbi:MAG: 7-cyano-7-deazaguanine synthase QueC [Gammaproteobacteria bacterium]|nr:7-cyano-7-deazaguanine synthase QueC [Gammaproteobacteria bacterium]MDH5801431.1 7-cyano-7-deazaguanine synthase QueC [Gammaproteobacteria bacterium]
MNEKPHTNAIVLVSGGLDSATALAMAKSEGYTCYALSFDYGQRHRCELEAAKRVTTQQGVVLHRVFSLELGAMGGSALTDTSLDVPTVASSDIPITYVPARNTVFLSIALAWAEVLPAQHIFIGVNAVDYSGYPDCRPEFIASFEQTANLGTKKGVQGEPFKIHTPLISLTKAQIITKGIALGLDYSLTTSCYNPDAQGRACGKCDSCRIRKDGFAAAAVDDPTVYQ